MSLVVVVIVVEWCGDNFHLHLPKQLPNNGLIVCHASRLASYVSSKFWKIKLINKNKNDKIDFFRPFVVWFASCFKLLILLQYLCSSINIWFEKKETEKNKQFHEMFRDYWFHLARSRFVEFKIHQKSGNPGNFHEISFRIIMLIVYLILKWNWMMKKTEQRSRWRSHLRVQKYEWKKWDNFNGSTQVDVVQDISEELLGKR
jgi:hypothetical protein